MTNALVLLSGGLDSVAAMHWSIGAYSVVRALSFDYGQANRDAELAAAQRISQRCCVQWDGLHLADAVRGFSSLKPAAPGLAAGISRANLPARNPLLLSVAAAHACRVWPGGAVDLVIGANLDDAAGFPDCRPAFISAASDALGLACVGVSAIRVVAPWVASMKSEILRWCLRTGGHVLVDACDSVSCYAGTRCGTCDPCTLRAAAFSACELEDNPSGVLSMHGGDPARETR